MTATRTPKFPGRATYRQAAVVLLASGVLAGCGLGEPKQSSEQAYEAMYAEATTAVEAAFPGVEVTEDVGSTEECGGWDILGTKDASKLVEKGSIGVSVLSGDNRSLERLARDVQTRLEAQGWQAVGRSPASSGESPLPEEEPDFSEDSDEAVQIALRKADTGQMTVRSVGASEFDTPSVYVLMTTQCLRNPEWGNAGSS